MGEDVQYSRTFSRAFNQFYLYAKPRETRVGRVEKTKHISKKKKKTTHKAPPDAKALNLLTGKWLHAAT